MGEEILIKFGKRKPDFNFSMEAEGFQGPGCTAALDELMDSIGGIAIEIEPKPEIALHQEFTNIKQR